MFKIDYNPWQKLAQRDQSGMVDLLQICCLMCYVWPKLEAYLGAGKLLDNIMEQWKLGNLGWTGQNHVFLGTKILPWKSKPCIFGNQNFNLESVVEFKFRSTNPWPLEKSMIFKLWILGTKNHVFLHKLGFVLWNLNSAWKSQLEIPHWKLHDFYWIPNFQKYWPSINPKISFQKSKCHLIAHEWCGF